MTLAESVEHAKAERSKSRTGPYKHLMTGVSYMLPVVIAGGLAIALAFAIGGIYAGDQKGTLGAALSLIGGGTAFHLFVAVLSGFIAFSIADRPGIAPGLVGGMLAQTLGAGFLGGIVSGFLAGYLTKFLADKIKLPATLEGLKPVLILPFLSTIAVGLLMIYVIAPPVQALERRHERLAQRHARRERGLPRSHPRRDDGFRHGRPGQQGRLHVRGRVARE